MRPSDEVLASGTRVAARIAHGGHYHGWQAQPHLQVSTTQETLKKALSTVAGTPVSTWCAGRTDTGVHGFAQIIHLTTPSAAASKPGSWAAIATCLMMSASIGRCRRAQTSMLGSARRQRITAIFYVIRQLGRPHCMGWWMLYRHDLDLVAMNDAAKYLHGEQDFSAFRAASCQANSPMRHVSDCHIHRRGDFSIVGYNSQRVSASYGPQYYGIASCCGTHSRSVDWFPGVVLLSRDRTQLRLPRLRGSISLGSTIRRFWLTGYARRPDGVERASALKLLNWRFRFEGAQCALKFGHNPARTPSVRSAGADAVGCVFHSVTVSHDRSSTGDSGWGVSD